MTKRETFKTIKDQLKEVSNLVIETDPRVYALLAPAYDELSSLLFRPQALTEEKLTIVKDKLHLLDSIIAGMDNHGEGDEINHEFFWAYLYGVHDRLLYELDFGEYSEETSVGKDNYESNRRI